MVLTCDTVVYCFIYQDSRMILDQDWVVRKLEKALGNPVAGKGYKRLSDAPF